MSPLPRRALLALPHRALALLPHGERPPTFHALPLEPPAHRRRGLARVAGPLPWPAMLAAIGLLTAGCDDPEGGFGYVAQPDDIDPVTLPGVGPDAPPGGGCALSEPGEPQIQQSYDLGAQWWRCPVNLEYDAPLCACIDGYLELADHLTVERPALTAAEFDAMLRSYSPTLSGQVQDSVFAYTEAREPAVLRQDLLASTGGCELHESASTRPLGVTIVSEQVTGGLIVRELFFDDPLLGRFPALLMLPLGAGPFPAVLGMHGHGDDPRKWLELDGGEDLPDEGYAVLSLGLRGICVDESEDEAVRTLLRARSSVLAARTAEAEIGLRYLRWLPEVDDERVALMGHSTCSASGNVAIRIVPGFAAYVSDLKDHYWSFIDNPLMADVMSPATFPLHKLINDFTTSEVPVYEAGYGYGTLDPGGPDEWDRILDFFDDVMR